MVAGELSLALRDPRGRVLEINDCYLLVEHSGLGPVPAEHVVESGAFQVGETFRYGTLTARLINLAIDIVASSRTAVWEKRGELTKWLGHLPSGCYLVWTLPDGSTREILGRYVGSPELPRKVGMGPLYQRCVFTLRCPDPGLYDPTGVIWQYAVASGTGLWGFPLGFPRGFGVSTVDVTEVKNYPGTLSAHPVITVVGPANDLIIENETTSEVLDFKVKAYSIAAGETVTIDCRPGHKSVVNSVAGNIIYALSEDSDLGTFHLAPDPAALDGDNSMHVSLTGGTNATRVYLLFYSQYNGLTL